jgi:hypothetical protein
MAGSVLKSNQEVSNMKDGFFRNLPSLIIITLLTINFSCSTVKYLKTETISETEMTGVFTLFLYSEYQEIEIAILDIEGDQYTIEMSGSQYNYVAARGVTAESAVKSAVGFINSQRTWWSRILAPDGSVIGYDLRARYNTLHYGIPDILDVSYWIEDEKVIVEVDIKQSIRKSFYRRVLGD